MSSSSRRTLLAAAAGGLLVAGCGFELRRPPRLAFQSIALAGFGKRSPLAEEFRRQLGEQVKVLDDVTKVQVVLHAIEDRRERSVVSSTAAAQVLELQLRLKFNFRADTPLGRELIPRTELLLSRDLTYSETAALAKEAEEADLFRDMQADVVRQVLRRLAAVQV